MGHKYAILAAVMMISCFGCVQETYMTHLIWEVDVSTESNVSDVGIIGSELPLTWDTALPLADENNDSIYVGYTTVDIPWDKLEYKAKIGENRVELYGQNNRVVDLTQGDTVVLRIVYNQE